MTNCNRSRTAPILASALLLLAAGIAPATAQQTGEPRPFEVEYEVLRNGRAIGSSRLQLRRDGDTWRYDSHTAGERGMASLIGLRVRQHTQLIWHEGRPRPLRSSYEQDATLSSRRIEIRYDWDAGQYRLTNRKGEHRFALVDGAVDRYSASLAIGQHLADGERDFIVHVADADGVRGWRFHAVGEETVDTPAGAIRALKVERIRDDERSITSWHDPQRGYLAVRLMQREDGNTIESRLRQYRSEP